MKKLRTHRRPVRAQRQRGVVLLFSLIALVVLLIASVALMRSFNSSLFMSGNIAFKRDLQNQGERAVVDAMTQFRPGNPLSTAGGRAADSAPLNYSASILPTNAQGIPSDLALSDTAFAAKWTRGDIPVTGQAVSIRYVIDRLCSTAGDETTLGASSCQLSNTPAPAGGSASNLLGADKAPLCSTCSSAAPIGVVYRLSIRVAGPRNTVAFFQSTFTTS
jgi:Tfp pilus assembly protein PilX